MKKASAAKIAAKFDEYLEASLDQPVLVTRNGKPVAVLVAVQNRAEAERVAAGGSRSLRSVLAEGHEQVQKSGDIPHNQFWRDLKELRRGRAGTGEGEDAEA